jgi:hypothetical protein
MIFTLFVYSILCIGDVALPSSVYNMRLHLTRPVSLVLIIIASEDALSTLNRHCTNAQAEFATQASQVWILQQGAVNSGNRAMSMEPITARPTILVVAIPQ